MNGDAATLRNALERAGALLFAIVLLTSCARPRSPQDEFKDMTGILLQGQTGQRPPGWLILRAGSVVSLGILPIGGTTVTICATIGSGCKDYDTGEGVYEVERVVAYGAQVGNYAVHIRKLGWVGAGDILPVVPAGTIIQNQPCSEESSDTQSDCSHEIDTDPDAGGNTVHVPDFTQLRVDFERPGHLYYLHVTSISGPTAGAAGFAGGDGGYETPSGYIVDDVTGAFVSVVVTR